MAGGRDFESELLAVLEKVRRVVPPSEEAGLINEVKALPFPSEIKTEDSLGLMSTIYEYMVSDVGLYETIPDKIARLQSTMKIYNVLSAILYSINPELREVTSIVRAAKKLETLEKTKDARLRDAALAKAEEEGRLFAESMLADAVSGGGRRRRRRGGSTRRRKQQRKKTLRRKA